MSTEGSQPSSLRERVDAALRAHPIVAVVRDHDRTEAQRQAELFVSSGLALVEVTFTVPDACGLARDLLAERPTAASHFVGMGTVTTAERARRAVAAGAEFLVSPNASPEVAAVAKEHNLFLVLGALTATEIVVAHQLGADLVKVFPLPPVGGPAYLRAVRGPLGDIEMLASGGYGPEEIPAYRAAGARAFGIGAPLLTDSDEATRERIARALESAR